MFTGTILNEVLFIYFHKMQAKQPHIPYIIVNMICVYLHFVKTSGKKKERIYSPDREKKTLITDPSPAYDISTQHFLVKPDIGIITGEPETNQK